MPYQLAGGMPRYPSRTSLGSDNNRLSEVKSCHRGSKAEHTFERLSPSTALRIQPQPGASNSLEPLVPLMSVLGLPPPLRLDTLSRRRPPQSRSQRAPDWGDLPVW